MITGNSNFHILTRNEELDGTSRARAPQHRVWQRVLFLTRGMDPLNHTKSFMQFRGSGLARRKPVHAWLARSVALALGAKREWLANV